MTQPSVRFQVKDNYHLTVYFSGTWSINVQTNTIPNPQSYLKELSNIKSISFKLYELETWDTSLISYIFEVINYAKQNDIPFSIEELPQKLRNILELALTVPKKQSSPEIQYNWLGKTGLMAVSFYKSFLEVLSFTGSITLTSFRMLIGKNRFRFSETCSVIQKCGPEALPIITLISVLIGLILAYIGAVQLQMFGAVIYVANLVGIAMLREMGAIMAAIVMAGRTGAAFAAQLGTMQVNEEIDAFKTFGIHPMEMLVVPRMLALVLMMPLLCLYSDILGILGGAIVGILTLGIDPELFFRQVTGALTLSDLFVGLVKSMVFGVLIASAGCLRGIQCARSASAVGEAVTGAVVSSIVAIVVTDAIFAVVTNILGV